MKWGRGARSEGWSIRRVFLFGFPSLRLERGPPANRGLALTTRQGFLRNEINCCKHPTDAREEQRINTVGIPTPRGSLARFYSTKYTKFATNPSKPLASGPRSFGRVAGARALFDGDAVLMVACG